MKIGFFPLRCLCSAISKSAQDNNNRNISVPCGMMGGCGTMGVAWWVWHDGCSMIGILVNCVWGMTCNLFIDSQEF